MFIVIMSGLALPAATWICWISYRNRYVGLSVLLYFWMTNPDPLSNGYTFKFVLFFISLIAFICTTVKLFRCFLFMTFDSILLIPCCNLSAFSKCLSFSSSSAQISVVWMMSMYGPCMLEQILGLNLKVVFCFRPVLSELDL